MHVARYSGALPREQFMFQEMRIVAQLVRQGLAQAEIVVRVFDENLFQYPTERELRSKCRAALKRLSCIEHSPALVEILAEGALSEARQAALVAMMAQSRLTEEFMTEVVGEKYRLLDMTLTQKDVRLFFERLCERDGVVAGWSSSTVKRIGSVLMNVLRENGYLEKIGSETLCQVLISAELEQALRDAGFQRFLPAFNVLN